MRAAAAQKRMRRALGGAAPTRHACCRHQKICGSEERAALTANHQRAAIDATTFVCSCVLGVCVFLPSRALRREPRDGALVRCVKFNLTK